MNVRSIWEKNPRTRKVSCDGCGEEHTIYRVWWKPNGDGVTAPDNFRWGVPPWAFAKYRGWCPSGGESAGFTDRQGNFPATED